MKLDFYKELDNSISNELKTKELIQPKFPDSIILLENKIFRGSMSNTEYKIYERLMTNSSWYKKIYYWFTYPNPKKKY